MTTKTPKAAIKENLITASQSEVSEFQNISVPVVKQHFITARQDSMAHLSTIRDFRIVKTDGKTDQVNQNSRKNKRQ